MRAPIAPGNLSGNPRQPRAATQRSKNRGRRLTSGRSEKQPLVAIVDDDPESAAALAALLPTSSRYGAIAFTNGGDFLASLNGQRPDAVVLDLSMPAPDGREILRRLQLDGFGHIPVIVVTGSGDDAIADAIALGAFAAMQKPVDVVDLVSQLRVALQPNGRQKLR